MLFIMLSGLILLTALWRIGTISASLCAGLAVPLIIIFVLTVINRSQYTNIFRDKRYWNRNTFNDKYGKIPVPLCPGALSGIESGLQSMESSVQSGISSAGQMATSAANMTAQGITSAGQDISSAGQGITSAAQGMMSSI